MEQLLRNHRDQAIKLLQENQAQTREGIELLVQNRLGALASALRPAGAAPGAAELEALYREALDLAYVMFSLGYSVARTLPGGARSR